MNSRGKLIVLEGIDGSGKSTQASLLYRALEARGVACACTREPSDSPAGQLIRRILTGQEQMDPRALAGLFVADRIQHLAGPGGILEQLAAGISVICDRYYFSSYAYHSLDVPMDWVIQVNEEAARMCRPDLTVFVDVQPEDTIARIRSGRDHTELFEKLDTLKQVRKNYFTAFEKLRDREHIAVVDGSGTVEEVARRIADAVYPCFGLLP